MMLDVLRNKGRTYSGIYCQRSRISCSMFGGIQLEHTVGS